MKAMLSSNTNEYSTLQWLFDELDCIFHFDVDVCATKNNAKCNVFYTKEQDGLLQNWYGNVWCNPPYSKEEKACKLNCKKKKCLTRGHILEDEPGEKAWWRKAWLGYIGKNFNTVLLVKSKTGSSWQQEFLWKMQPKIVTDFRFDLKDIEVMFIPGRLKFNGESAPFESMIVSYQCK